MSAINAKHKEINRNIFSPKLRFVNFSKEWNEISFGDAFDFKQTNSLSRDKLNYECGKVKNIHYGDIHTKFHSNFYINKENVPYINEDINLNKIDSENYCKENDLIIADASEDYLDIGKSIEIRNLDNQKVVSGLHTLIARPKSNYFSQGTLGYLMRSRTVRLQIMILAQGTKVLGISPKHLNKIIFKLPEILEQQKLAEFLESTDSWIGNLKQQKKSLEIYKKGMMQKIFAQEIRFKDKNGNGFPEWEEKELRFCAEKIWIGLVTTMTTSYETSGTCLIRNQNIRENKIVDESPIYLNDKFANLYKSRSVKFGDVVTVHTGDVGTSAVIDHKYDGAQGFATLNTRLNTSILNNFYLSFFFNSKKYKTWALRYSTGDGRNNLNLNDFIKSKIPLPCIFEQQRIAEFLILIDKLLESKQQQIAKAEEWKKGLMQGLFV